MTYQRHWLLSWGGVVAQGADVFTNNVRFFNPEFGSPDSLDAGQLDSLLSGFIKDIRALFANPAAHIPSPVQCQWVKFNEIGPDGRYTDTDSTNVRFLTGTTGDNALINGTGAGQVPTYQTVCVTTTTARQRGPASRGRLFIPQCNAGIDGLTGKITSTHQQDMATAYAAFFTALGDEEGIDTTGIAPAVVSNVGNPGPMERITGVKVGNVPDVQRRRKNAMLETYITASVSTT